MRSKRILQELINKDVYLNVDYFADLFKVSTKTISNTMKTLKKDSDKNGFNIKLKKGKGYYIEIASKELFNSYMEELEDEYSEIFSPEYRVSYIIVLFLLSKEFITIDYISEKINVSKSIVKLDIKKVENELKEKDIILEKKAHYGIRILCSDYIRKSFILDYYKDGNEFINTFIESKIVSNDFKDIENELINLLKENKLKTNCMELEQILSFIKVTIALHNNLNGDNDSRSTKELSDIVIKLRNVIKNKCNVLLSYNDLLDVEKYLDNKVKSVSGREVYHCEVKDYIEDFIKTIDKEYNTDFSKDEEFKKNLSYHLSLLIERLQKEISFSNPLVKEISIKYPTIFDIAIKLSNEIQEKYHISISSDEVGFIATHFAAHLERELYKKIKNYSKIALICSTGKGSALLMKLKIEMLFPASDIRTYSFLEEDEVEKFNPDIIFTNWKLNKKFNMPVVYINELIDDVDLLKIKNVVNMNNDLSVYNEKNDFLSLFRKDMFNILDSNEEYMDIIESMGNSIESKMYAHKGYTSYVLEREEHMSTIYDNGIAIPHPINVCGTKNIVNVTILKNKVLHKGKEVKIIFMVALEKEKLRYHEIITRVLFKVMQDEKLVEKIRKSKSYEEFLININEIGV